MKACEYTALPNIVRAILRSAIFFGIAQNLVPHVTSRQLERLPRPSFLGKKTAGRCTFPTFGWQLFSRPGPIDDETLERIEVRGKRII